MDGAPIFSLFPLGPPGNGIARFSPAFLNSTTNVVLTEMEKGRSLDEAVKRAQAIGIAETDPTHDLDGWDASGKKSPRSSNVLMGVPLRIEQVQRTGIRELKRRKNPLRASGGDALQADLLRAERRGDGAECRVGPELLLMTDPMASLEGTSSAIRFDLDVMEHFSLVEHNPGIEATGYGLLADFSPRRQILSGSGRFGVREQRSRFLRWKHNLPI